MEHNLPTTDCGECRANQCDRCTRPGGTRPAADGRLYRTCCCGRRFRTGREIEPTLGGAYARGWADALHAAAEAIRAAERGTNAETDPAIDQLAADQQLGDQRRADAAPGAFPDHLLDNDTDGGDR